MRGPAPATTATSAVSEGLLRNASPSPAVSSTGKMKTQEERPPGSLQEFTKAHERELDDLRIPPGPRRARLLAKVTHRAGASR